MDKTKKRIIIDRLEERNYLRNLHNTMTESLVGSLKNEYLMKLPMKYPYEEKLEATDTIIGLPIFRAMVDMMVAHILHTVIEKLLEEVLEVIEPNIQNCEEETK